MLSVRCHDYSCPKHVTYSCMTDVPVLLVWVGWQGGCHSHACPKHVAYGRMTDVPVLLVWVCWHGGCHEHACPKHVAYGCMTNVTVLLVRVGWQGRQPIEWGRILRSCLSKACCLWLHARSKPLFHAFILDRPLSFHIGSSFVFLFSSSTEVGSHIKTHISKLQSCFWSLTIHKFVFLLKTMHIIEKLPKLCCFPFLPILFISSISLDGLYILQ